MVQRADAAEAQDRRDLCVFILVENELKSFYLDFHNLDTASDRQAVHHGRLRVFLMR